MFKEFLNDVITENILHKLKSIRLDFSENLVFLVAIRRLKLLLDKSRTVLIATEFNDMIVDILALR